MKDHSIPRDRETEREKSLRNRAEEQAEQLHSAVAENLTPEEAGRLIHELQVHQIELKMQNEELRQTQKELEDSRTRYFDLYDLAPVGYVTLNEKGLILEANLTAGRLLATTRKALIKRPLSHFVLPDDRDALYLSTKELFKTGDPQSWEMRMLRSNSPPFWAHLEAVLYRDDDGLPTCRCIMSDITGPKRVEEKLRKSEADSKRLAQENELIAEIGRIVSSTLNIEDMYEQFARKLKTALPFDLITVNMINVNDRTRTRIYSSDSRYGQNTTEPEVYPIDGTRTEEVVQTKSCLLTDSRNREDNRRKYPGMVSRRQWVQSTLHIPLIAKNEVFWVMSIQSVQDNAYCENDLLLAQKISTQMAGAIANAQLFVEHERAGMKIKEQLREKELLLLEIHHRVKNNIQVMCGMLDLQARNAKNPETIKLCQETKDRIRSIALIHSQLYKSNDLSHIDLGEYARILANELAVFYRNPGNRQLNVNAGEVIIGIDKAVPCGLILNELISNAFKHAFVDNRGGQINVTIRNMANNLIEMTVDDNGVGLSPDIDIGKANSVGLYMVNGLVKNQLDGELLITSNGGTKCKITIPG